MADIFGEAASQCAKRGWEVVRGPSATSEGPIRLTDRQRAELLSGVDLIVTSSRSRITPEDLDGSPRLRGLVFPTIGVDAVDLGECSKRGLLVAHGAARENFVAMAESTIMLMLVLLYGLDRSEKILRNHLERPRNAYARLLAGRRVGLIGLGRIGGGIAERLSTWDAEILVHDPHLDRSAVPANVRLVEKAELLQSSDIVSLHVPLNAQTRGMLGEAELRMMKPDAILVNTSRGGLIDEDALVRVMKTGHLAGVGLDVFETEPLPHDHPLREIDRTILTPHIVGHTTDYYAVMGGLFFENIAHMLEGRLPRYVRNPDVSKRWLDRFGGEAAST